MKISISIRLFWKVDVAELLGEGKVLAGLSLDGVSDSLDAIIIILKSTA